MIQQNLLIEDAVGASQNSRISAQTLLVLATLITLLTLGRCAVHEFVNWDDRSLLADNPKFNPPTWSSVLGFILPKNADEYLYVPATQFLWGLLAAIGHTDTPDARGSLLNPWVFHCANLAAHIACTAMVLAILLSFASDLPAWIGTLVFAIHPVQVETVAWASGMRDLLAALFGFVCLYQLIQFRTSHRRAHWIMATLALALAMLSKPSAVALPLAALVLDVVLLHTRLLRSLADLALWFALGIPVVLVTRHVQPIVWPIDTPLLARPLIALDSIAFYITKLIVPTHLVFDYGRTPQVALGAGWRWIWLLPLLLAALLVWKGNRAPRMVAGVLLAVVGVVPVLGLVSFQAQTYSGVSDHYLYPSMLGIALMVSCTIEWAARRWSGRYVYTIAGILVAALACQAFAQAAIWSNSASFFSYAVAVNPRSSNANAGFAASLAEAGDLPDAVAHFQIAERLNPHNGMAMMGLAQLLMREGDLDGAAAQYEQLMQVYQMQLNFDPRLGAAGELVVAARLMRRGNAAGAIAALEQARQWDPGNPQIDALLRQASALAQSHFPAPSSSPSCSPPAQ